ncbi:MAG: glycosyltransferase family 39 protein [Candidatus Eiseniibacteriota bacterium]|nr:MAG: glycosyltransferase family 39 protein [Candidatus Eisenbacteria bacterium]
MNNSEPNRPIQRTREVVDWVIMLGAAFLVRWLFYGSRKILEGDEIHYAESLHRFLQGRILDGLSDYWSFFYPFSAIPFGLLSGDAETGLRLLSIFSGALLVLPCVLLARRLWGRRVAIFAGHMVALHPILILFSTQAMTETFYSLLVVSSLLLLFVHMKSGTWSSLVLAGILLGLAYQTRQEAQFFIALALVVLLLGRGGAGIRRALKGRIQRAVVMAVISVVLVLPYFLLLHQKTGHWTTGAKAPVTLSSRLVWEDGLERERFVYSLNDAGTARRIDEIGRESPLRILWKEKRAIASRYFKEFSQGFTHVPILLASPLLLLLVPLGLFGRKWEKENGGPELILLLVGVFPFALYSMFQVNFRFLIPFLPVYLLWGARGCGVLCDWLRENVSNRRLVYYLALVLVFGSLVAYTAHKYRTGEEGQAIEYKEIGMWIRANEGEGARILAHSGCPASYYAGNPEATFIPWTDLDGLMRYARHHRYSHLLVDADYFMEARPDLAQLVGGSPVPELEEVKTFTGRRENRIILYRLKSAPVSP